MRSSSDMATANAPEVGADRAGPARWFRPLFSSAGRRFRPELILVFAIGLDRDPSRVPSPLIGKPVPQFSLPPVKGRSLGLSTADLRGEVRSSTCSPPGVWPAARSTPCSCG